MTDQSGEIEIAFLEELTGHTAKAEYPFVKSKYNIYVKNDKIPFAIIQLDKDEDGIDYMSVRLAGETYFFEFNSVDWLERFEEIWQNKIKRLECIKERQASVAQW